MAREYFLAYHSFLPAMEMLDDAERGRLFTALLKYSMSREAPALSGNEALVFPMFRYWMDKDAEKYENKCKKNRENAVKSASSNSSATGTEQSESEPNATERYRTQPIGSERDQDITDDTERGPNAKAKAKANAKANANAKAKAKEDTLPEEPPAGDPSVAGDVADVKPVAAEEPVRPVPEEKPPRKPPRDARGADAPPPPEFLQFWEAYPRKVSKPDALKAWMKLAPDEALVGNILTGLECWRRCDQWKRDGGQYIPYPATFLRRRAWEDDPRPEVHDAGRPVDTWDDMPEGFWGGGA